MPLMIHTPPYIRFDGTNPIRSVGLIPFLGHTWIPTLTTTFMNSLCFFRLTRPADFLNFSFQFGQHPFLSHKITRWRNRNEQSRIRNKMKPGKHVVSCWVFHFFNTAVLLALGLSSSWQFTVFRCATKPVPFRLPPLKPQGVSEKTECSKRCPLTAVGLKRVMISLWFKSSPWKSRKDWKY